MNKPISGSERTRRWRERKAIGQKAIRIEVTRDDARALIRLGLLHPTQRDERCSIARAIEGLLERHARTAQHDTAR